MRRKWRYVAVAACMGLIAAACGGDDDDDGGAERHRRRRPVPKPKARKRPPQQSPRPRRHQPRRRRPRHRTEETEAEEETGASVDPASIEFDVGVDDTTIRVGMLADLSGAFAALVQEIVEAQQVYWDDVNANGGIAGRQVELVIEDNAYDVAQNVEKYQILKDQVAIISQATGSPHTAAIAQDLVNDDMIAIPLSWYSGWADPELGENALETYTSYCIESMNGVEWLQKNRDVQTMAIISFPGEYGGDGAEGAKRAAEELGIEIVYDGTGQVTPPTADNPNPDQSAVVSQIVSTNPDLVWATINPSTLSAIMSNAVGQGYQGLWSGNSPTYSWKLLGTDAGPVARPVLHRLDVHRDVGRRRARYGRGGREDDRGPAGPRRLRRVHPRLDRGDGDPGDPREGRRER